MGLCKCPKKRVTNQFCFEHRVNVCEHCMVSNHTKCVVQSYLQWLQDSDYDPNCQLCKNVLADGECVRLICYHIFHWSCLNKYACEFPAHTAPAGYTCPTCNVCIFPPSNVVSPVADILRNTLLGENWARSGLGFPVISEMSEPEKLLQEPDVSPSHWKNTASKATKQNPQTNSVASTSYMSSTTASSVRPEPYGASFTASTFSTPRKMYDSTEHGLYHRTVVDHDEDKYKRRSAFEWFSRWFNSRTTPRSHRRDPQVFYKRWVVILILSLIAFCTVIIFFLRMGRAGVDSDPLLDPHLNPNIRVQDNNLGLVAPQAQHAAPAIDNIPSDDNAKLGLPVK